MSDPRVQRHARVLVRYSIRAKKGQVVDVSGATPAEPLIVAVYEELLRVGAHPVVSMAPAELPELFYGLAKQHHLTTLTAYDRACARHVDARVRIAAPANTRAMAGVDARKLAVRMKTQKPIRKLLLDKPSVITLHPTDASAQDAGMSLRDYEDFVYGAVFADREQPIAAWKDLRRRQQRQIARLRGADEVRIVGRGTDLRMSVKGRKFLNADGTVNMPSGELYAAPIEDSAEGHIEYDFPARRAGREIEGIRLVFRAGRVVEASAREGEAYLMEMLDLDRDARRIGELGIGTNMSIQRFTRNLLFDEKIGGTVHLALGFPCTGTGGKTKSALHWDMIKDLRAAGAIYVDGKLFQKNGRFVPGFTR